MVTEERIKPALPQGGKYRAHRVNLSRRGKGLYQLLTGEKAAQGEKEAGQAGEQEGK
jgi:hypothetical protein